MNTSLLPELHWICHHSLVVYRKASHGGDSQVTFYLAMGVIIMQLVAAFTRIITTMKLIL